MNIPKNIFSSLTDKQKKLENVKNTERSPRLREEIRAGTQPEAAVSRLRGKQRGMVPPGYGRKDKSLQRFGIDDRKEDRTTRNKRVRTEPVRKKEKEQKKMKTNTRKWMALLLAGVMGLMPVAGLAFEGVVINNEEN